MINPAVTSGVRRTSAACARPSWEATPTCEALPNSYISRNEMVARYVYEVPRTLI